MPISLKRTFTANITLKAISLILGYSFWFILSRSYTTTFTHTVPVALYGASADYTIDAPEQIHVTLSGKRSDLAELKRSELAVHVDGKNLQVGANPLIVSCATLFLPEHIKVLNYSPVPSIITVTAREQKTPSAQSAERSCNATT